MTRRRPDVADLLRLARALHRDGPLGLRAEAETIKAEIHTTTEARR